MCVHMCMNKQHRELNVSHHSPPKRTRVGKNSHFPCMSKNLFHYMSSSGKSLKIYITYTYLQVIHKHYLLIKNEQNSFKINFKWKTQKGKTLVLSAWYSGGLFLLLTTADPGATEHDVVEGMLGCWDAGL